MDRQRDIFLPSIVLDRASPRPLHQQVRSRIARAIRSGTPGGVRLPSTRVLARLLGVSRNTVLAAYDDLAADGLIRGTRGAGMLIAASGNRGLTAFDPRRVLREAQYPARCLYVGARCSDCGILGCYADWKIGYEPSLQLLDQA